MAFNFLEAVEGILWDLDATIIDTESMLDDAILIALKTASETARGWSEDKLHEDLANALRASRGGPDKGPGSWPSIVLATMGLIDISEQALHDATYAHFNQFLNREHTKLMPGALRCIQDLAGIPGNIPQAIVTSGTRPQTEKKQGFLPEVFSHMQRVVTVDEVFPCSKPHPLPYLLAASALGINAANCIAIEDSIPGITSAAAAGAWVIAVPLSHHREKAASLIGSRGVVLESLEQWTTDSIRRLKVVQPTTPLPLPQPLPACTLAYLDRVQVKAVTDGQTVDLSGATSATAPLPASDSS